MVVHELEARARVERLERFEDHRVAADRRFSANVEDALVSHGVAPSGCRAARHPRPGLGGPYPVVLRGRLHVHREQDLARHVRVKVMRHPRGQHEQGPGAQLLFSLGCSHLDMSGQRLDRHQPVGHMVHEPAIRLEVEQDERHGAVVGDRHLPVAIRGRMRLRSQLPCDLGEVVDVLRAGESLDGCAAQTRLLLFHGRASSCLPRSPPWGASTLPASDELDHQLRREVAAPRAACRVRSLAEPAFPGRRRPTRHDRVRPWGLSGHQPRRCRQLAADRGVSEIGGHDDVPWFAGEGSARPMGTRQGSRFPSRCER